MPYGWALWLRSLPPLPVHPHARPAEVVDLLGERPPAARAPGRELSRWPAFFSLFHQGWLPPPRDERPLRWFSGTGSLVLHVLFIAALAWMAYLQSLLPPPPPEAGGGGERVAIGFIGAGDPGTPQSEAPAASSSATGEPVSASESSTPASTPAEAADESASSPPVPQEVAVEPAPTPPAPTPPQVAEVAEPDVAEVPAEQPVQVTEVEQPTIDYVLPPATPREVTAPAIRQPQLREREVAVVELPAIRTPQARPVDVPLVQPRELQLRTREVNEPLPQVALKPVTVEVPQVQPRLRQAPESTVRERELAMPSPPAPAPAAAPASAPATTPAAAPATAAQAGGAPPGMPTGPAAAPRATSGGASPAASPRPAPGSGWDSPVAGDDWGQARSGQARPGGAPGLFDGDGRVRLPGEGAGQGPGPAAGEGMAERGAPGSDSDRWTRDRIDQSGTWLKRPPYDYEPTSFDRFWVPNESLLAEWVRKGMKSVAIPIPGTGKKINCMISVLQLGGGCGISDPDLNEQPADGRPPPDVPFKPELQEDNGSVRP
ncbi:hypothetical protein [Pseudoxanthomonas daejeonensis]|nr:hypothetical protein [Pseudoxanthomonas daejeonensis]